MSGYSATVTRFEKCRWFLVIVFAVAWAGMASAHPPTIVRVEQKWELVIGTPDPNIDAPQVTCVISPLGDVDSLHATLELNNQSLPEFVAGGLQLQVWEGEAPVIDRKFPDQNVFQQTGETVRWTQSMELGDGGLLTFEITDGTSTTWGNFGGQGYLKASLSTTLTDLNAYDPAVSIENSGVGYAGNRVRSLVLKEVHLYTSTGEHFEDADPKVIHSSE